MERFMPSYDHRAELAPRDVVARSIDSELKKRKETYVLLDISHKPAGEILSHFPNIAAECLKYGLDITKQPIPVVPAAHYICGGVQTGLHGETSVLGLYAAGEVACTGLHGANRLGSNSMLEALVFSQRAVKPAIDYVLNISKTRQEVDEIKAWPRPLGRCCSSTDSNMQEILQMTYAKRRQLQAIMWEFVGLVRSTERLKVAQKKICRLELDWEDELFRKGWQPNMVHVKVCELRNLILVANLVVNSALARQESRGSHYSIDFPELVESKRMPTILFPDTPLNTACC
jgi:L-aspartate oxidase